VFTTNRLVPAIAIVVLAISACDRTPTSSDTARRPDRPSMATNVSTVCMSAYEPTGYVILSYSTSFSCGSSGGFYNYPNAKTIGLPASPETVCTGSSVPSGWVITAYGGYTSSCDPYANSTGLPRDRMTIKIPGASETVCDSSPVPSNYQIGASTWLSACDLYNEGYRGWNNAFGITRI
jgi:hypothetical protein